MPELQEAVLMFQELHKKIAHDEVISNSSEVFSQCCWNVAETISTRQLQVTLKKAATVICQFVNGSFYAHVWPPS